uniref:Uncharacterized protein n=1 Tax=Anguilla anguilla TaxID=7936 RepID=A0A0E9UAH2_ANGAN
MKTAGNYCHLLYQVLRTAVRDDVQPTAVLL